MTIIEQFTWQAAPLLWIVAVLAFAFAVPLGLYVLGYRAGTGRHVATVDAFAEQPLAPRPANEVAARNTYVRELEREVKSLKEQLAEISLCGHEVEIERQSTLRRRYLGRARLAEATLDRINQRIFSRAVTLGIDSTAPRRKDRHDYHTAYPHIL